MADTDITEQSLYALIIMNTAIKNVRLYPPTSTTIVSAIEKLHQAFAEMLMQEDPIVFAESDKNILVCGNPLSQKDQEKIQVAALLSILLSFGLKSISFGQGLEKEELSAFTEILSRKPDVIKSEGGLPQVFEKNNITHIYLDQKVYVALDKDKKVFDISDEQIANFFASTHPELESDPQKLQEMTKDPEWLAQAFQAGLKQLMEQKETLSYIQITESLGNMIGLLDKVAGNLDQQEKETISKSIGDAIIKTDSDMAIELTKQSIEHLFGGVLLQYLISKLDDNINTGALQTGTGGGGEGLGGALPGKAGQGETGSSSGDGDGQEKIDFKARLMAVAAKMSLRLKDNEKTVLDDQLMSVLPKIIEQLITHQEQETMQQIISRLVDNLFSKNNEVRAHAAKALTDIIDKLPLQRQTEMIENLSGRLVEWIRIETSVTPAYKAICNYLQNIAQDFINQQRFPEAIPVLTIFDGINSGTPEKNETIQEICARLILNLATEENIKLLYKEYNTNEHEKKDEAGKVLSMFGDITLKRMLDDLHADITGDERVRIMHLIIGAGSRAIPLVRERIRKDEPWYYLRNMAYILGQIGNEESAGALQQLLSHENEKLKNEALKSISKTGGNRRGKLLTGALHGADEKFKLKIIEALGSAKAADSVPDLLNILTTRPLVATATRSLLEEGICTALGAIGSADAIPVLSEIAESNSFFRIRSYPDKLRAAAARALESIRKKQVDAMPNIDITR